MELKITEVNGWSKTLEVKKAITRIGSAQSADIQLSSNSIAPLHLQILSNPDLPTGCRLVNLANPLEIKSNGNAYTLETYSIQDVSDGDEIRLGEYGLTFSVPFSTSLMRTSSSIEASLKLIDTTLQPHLVLDGLLTVKNVGEQDACQFQVSLNGLPEDCFHIDPIPLLYPGAQEEVRVRLFHKTTYPQAGRRELLLTINAPDDYPGEELVIKQSLYVAPVFKQTMELVDDIALSPAPEIPMKAEEPVEPEIAQPEMQVEEQAVVAPEQIWEPAPENIQSLPQVEVQETAEMEPVEELKPVNLQAIPPQVEVQDAADMEPVEEPAPENLQVIPQLVEVQEVIVANPAEETEPASENIQTQPQDEVREAAAVEPVEEPAPQMPIVPPEPEKPTKPPMPVLTVKHDAQDETWSDDAPHEAPKPPVVQDLAKVKVVRPHTEKYWDEN